MLRYVNTASSAGGDGTTNGTSGATRAYASLSAWEAAEQADLVTATEISEVRCCGTSADTTAVTVDGWTTNSSYYVWIRGNEDDAAGRSFLARWSTSHYRLSVSAAFEAALNVIEPYTRLTGLQIENTNASPRDVIRTNTGSNAVGSDGCIYDAIFGRHAGTGFDRNVFTQIGSRVQYRNCIGRGANSTNGGVFAAAFGGGGSAEMLCRNCVAAFGDVGFSSTSGSNTSTLTNCYAGGSGTNDYSANHTLTTCRSEDGSQSTTTAAFSTSAGCYFANVTYESEDFEIGGSSELVDVGTDLSGDFTTDIAGQTRPTGANTWDIGAWEYVAAGGGGNRRRRVLMTQ